MRACNLLEAGDTPRADAIIAKIRLDVAKRAGGKYSLDDALEIPCQRLLQACVRGDLAAAERLLKLSSIPGSYLHRVCGGIGHDDLSDRAILARLDSAHATWRESLAPEDKKPFSSIRLNGRKILLVMRERFFPSPASRKHELTTFMLESARQVGLVPLFFPVDALRPSPIARLHTASESLKDLIALIVKERPEFIVYDDFAMTSDDAGTLSRDDYFNLASFVRKLGIKLIGFYPDLWTANSAAATAFDFVDVFWLPNCSDFTLVSDGPVYTGTVPYPQSVFAPVSGHDGKDLDAVFTGTAGPYNYPRAIWLTLMRQRHIPCWMLCGSHLEGQMEAGDTPHDYARFMSRVRMTVNFSARTLRRHQMTGRTWEGILAGSLLLEEDNPHTAARFVPFVHYIPFRNIVELETYLRFFQKHEDIRRQMADRALEWYHAQYSQELCWRELLGHASRLSNLK